MEMPGLKSVLAKLPVKLPSEVENLVLQYLRKRHPTAVLISRLYFDRYEGVPGLYVSGPDLQFKSPEYGCIGNRKVHKILGFMLYSYDAITGKPFAYRSNVFLSSKPGVEDIDEEIERWERFI